MENSSLSVFGTNVADEPSAEPNKTKQSENGESIDIRSINIKCNGTINGICYEKQMKCYRPNVNELIDNLKRSLLCLNDEKTNKLSSVECDGEHMVRYLSPKLNDEWLNGMLHCECLPEDDRMPKRNQPTCCDDYKFNGSISFEMWKNIIESMNVTKAPTNTKSKETPMHVNILILGAGLAGLGAATAIFNSKMKFTYKILEAQNEAGGRVKSVNLINCYLNKKWNSATKAEKSQKCMIDAGAQWLHGRYNPLYTIAKKYDLLCDVQTEEGLGAFFNETGRQIDEFFVKKIDFQIGKLLKECEQFAQKFKSKPKTKQKMYPKSIGHFLREHFQTFIHNEIDNQNDKNGANNLFDWHQRFQLIDNSCMSLDQLSAKYWGKYSFNGESCQAHYNFKNGFVSCVDAILNELANTDSSNDEAMHCIHFNKNVIEIQINDTNCNQRAFESFHLIDNIEKKWNKLANVSVKCADGSCYTADHVLVTFPLGILKKTHQQLFKPGLPERMRMAIDSLGYETINKIFLEFNAPWWNDLDGIQFIYEDNCEENHRNNEKKHWTRYLTGFDVLKPNNSNLLLGWVGGVGALDMETFSDKQIIDDCIQLLSRFTNINVPLPNRYFCTRWHSNPFINGSYSYISTNCDHNETISENWLNQKLTINDFYPMCSVINDQSNHHNNNDDHLNSNRENSNKLPIVLFAGEACHDKYFSTAHGAFLSGMEQTEKFMNEYI